MVVVVHEVSGGEVSIWVDPAGVIMLKVREPFGDPVELTEEAAKELSELLRRLAADIS